MFLFAQICIILVDLYQSYNKIQKLVTNSYMPNLGSRTFEEYIIFWEKQWMKPFTLVKSTFILFLLLFNQKALRKKFTYI